uniref:Uncharacterized protein n=1 Tax=Cuerna arida TaxID=1464854 RepID=A0A1B6FH71_9HEMI
MLHCHNQTKKRSGQTPSRRSGTVQYYLKHNEDQKRVCKKMFLHTLGLNEWMVLNWINKNNVGDHDVDDPETLEMRPQTDSNGYKDLSKSKTSKKRQNLVEWLQSVPKLPSHYARRDTKKLYLEPTWTSKKEMYRTYKQTMIDQNKVWGSEALYDDVFNELNLSLDIPRKDHCDLCCSYKLGNISNEIYQQHIKEKDRARQEKEKDKPLAIHKQIYCLTCDLQAVKITP